MFLKNVPKVVGEAIEVFPGDHQVVTVGRRGIDLLGEGHWQPRPIRPEIHIDSHVYFPCRYDIRKLEVAIIPTHGSTAGLATAIEPGVTVGVNQVLMTIVATPKPACISVTITAWSEGDKL